YDGAQLRVGLNYQPARRRLVLEPAAQAGSHMRLNRAHLASFCRHIANQLIDTKLRRKWRGGPCRSHKHTAAVTELKPAFLFQFAISSACSVGVYPKAARQLACAGQPFAGTQ